ncbi:gamma-glutamylcyclotransferase family protein [Ferviditalea candida]|uniref:Gamma-glutamylcyclotransferase family protein n=1 Tax=Ferviditalea candida TaxID=3108399 RepID=A0ABU5ZHD0_9BACL|nr:gamma-glutamylcyclotransferase family protein [Paenibacillaceae bacterium T2]
MNNKVFVYGTLRAGESNFRLIKEHVLRVTPAYIYGKMYDVGDYPAAVIDPGSPNVIYGEIIELDNPAIAFKKMDMLEEYYRPFDPRNDYERVETEVFLPGGGQERCYIYVYTEERVKLLRHELKSVNGSSWNRKKE